MKCYNEAMKQISQQENFHEVSLLDTVIRVPSNLSYHFSLLEKKGDVYTAENLKGIHHHLHYEFFFILDGKLTIVTETGQTDYSSSVLVLPPFYRHYSFYQGGNAYGIPVYLPEKIGKEFPLFSKIPTNDLVAIPLTNEQTKRDLTFYFKKISNGSKKGKMEALKLNALLRLIFIEVNSAFCQTSEGGLDRSREGVIKYIEDIHNFVHRYGEERGVRIGWLAEKLNLSEKQTARIIRKEYGCTFTQLMNEHRLSVACMFLKNTKLSIREIVEQLNLGGENYFFALFKKKFGMTPTEYRKMKGEQHD